MPFGQASVALLVFTVVRILLYLWAMVLHVAVLVDHVQTRPQTQTRLQRALTQRSLFLAASLLMDATAGTIELLTLAYLLSKSRPSVARESRHPENVDQTEHSDPRHRVGAMGLQQACG